MTRPWRGVGCSVIGAAHVRAGRENQDALRLVAPADGVVIATVADGHGSEASFRSADGARLAVTLAVEVVGRMLTELSADGWAARAASTIVSAWGAAVDTELARAPFTPAELARITQAGPSATEHLRDLPRLAYGTTLIIAVASPDAIFYLQLGDGDILEVTESGAVTRPLPRDQRFAGNETLSLVSPGAEREFRTAVRATADAAPALIVLSTDGYPNSFRDDAGFLKVGSDLLELVRADGLAQVERDLPEWLREASTQGSGDDTTVALITRD